MGCNNSVPGLPLLGDTGPFAAGRPRVLFEEKYDWTSLIRDYDVTPDGQRFLMVRWQSKPLEPVTELHVVLDWFEELKRIVPTN